MEVRVSIATSTRENQGYPNEGAWFFIRLFDEYAYDVYKWSDDAGRPVVFSFYDHEGNGLGSEPIWGWSGPQFPDPSRIDSYTPVILPSTIGHYRWRVDVNFPSGAPAIAIAANGSYYVDFDVTPSPPCAIATVAYGSPLAPQLNVLRSFRDRCLPSQVTNTYYKLSPPVARWLWKHERARCLTRYALEPIVKALAI